MHIYVCMYETVCSAYFLPDFLALLDLLPGLHRRTTVPRSLDDAEYPTTCPHNFSLLRRIRLAIDIWHYANTMRAYAWKKNPWQHITTHPTNTLLANDAGCYLGSLSRLASCNIL